MNTETQAHWAIVYHTNSSSPRAQRWYYVQRVVHVDGRWWGLYRWEGQPHSEKSRAAVRERALAAGLGLLHGLFTDPPVPHVAGELIRTAKSA